MEYFVALLVILAPFLAQEVLTSILCLGSRAVLRGSGLAYMERTAGMLGASIQSIQWGRGFIQFARLETTLEMSRDCS